MIGARVTDEMFAFDIDLRVKPLFDPSVPHPTTPLCILVNGVLICDTHAALGSAVPPQASARDGASSGVGDDQNRPTKAKGLVLTGKCLFAS